MSTAELLERCCSELKSSKVTERKRGADTLNDLLDKPSAIKLLNSGRESTTWDDVVRAVHVNLMHESDKLQENVLKKVQRNNKGARDLLVHAVQKANQGCIRLSGPTLLQNVLHCLESKTLRKFFLSNYIMILKDHILPERQYVEKISPDSWITLLEALRKILLQPDCNDSKVAECVKLIFRHGPLYGFPLMQYRNQFQFVSNLCRALQRSTPTRYKSEVLQIVLEFCKGTACDCWLSCCKLGEENFINLRGLYERRSSDDTIKEHLFEIFLLQIKLHHPNGADESSDLSIASSRNEWKKQLKAIHWIVEEELQYGRMGGTPHFVTNGNGDKRHVFVSLAVEVYKQILSSDFTNVSQMTLNETDLTLDMTQPCKRQRLELGFDAMLTNMQASKNCAWIYIITALLRKYPDVINFEHSVSLLEILLKLQKETKDGDMQRCIYDCFSVLLTVQSSFNNELSDSEKLWEYVVDGVVRSIDMNVNATAIHNLLQNLIKMGKIKDSTMIYQTFASGRLSFTYHTLTTFVTTAEHFGIPEKLNGESFKQKIIAWIMDYNRNLTNMDTYEEEILVRTLMYLCSKQSPPKTNEAPAKEACTDFENVCILNTFENLIVSKKCQSHQLPLSHSINKELLLTVLDYFEEFALHFTDDDNDKRGTDYLKHLASAVIFFGNYLTEIKKLDAGLNVEATLERLKVRKLFYNFVAAVIERTSEPRKICFDSLKLLNNVLSRKFESFVSDGFRMCLGQEELGSLFGLMNTQVDESTDEDFTVELKLLCMNILCAFCMYDNKDKLSETQELVINSLSSFDVTDIIDYRMAISFLSYIPYCPKDLFNDEIILKILESVSSQCFKDYETKPNILKFLYDITPHVGQSGDNAVHRAYYTLLIDHFEMRNSYGPEVSLQLLNCFERICKENLYLKCHKYTEYSITVFVCNFLISNYQVVRLRAVECLLTIFNEQVDSPDVLKLQKTALADINLKCRDVFRIEGNLDGDRTVDETVTRTSSVLHTYGALIVCNSAWRKNLLFSLLTLVQDKKLQTGMVDKLIKLICKELGYKTNHDLFAQFMDYILKQWHSNQLSFESFPYFVIGCETQLDFFKKYVKIILPLIVEDRNLTQTESAIVEQLGTSVPELYEMCFVELITVSFLKIAVRSNDSAFDMDDKLYSAMIESLSGDKMEILLLERFDDVLVNTLKVIVNEKLYKEQFGVDYKMDIGDYPALCFHNVINFIKIKLKIQTDFFEHCSKTYPNKIQSILFQLTEIIYKKTCLDDKLKSLHQYFEFVDMLATHIKQKNPISNFCIRTIVHTLLHFSEEKIPRDNKFNIASVRYLKSFLQKIIPDCNAELSTYLNLIVNKLLPLILGDDVLAQGSITILKTLIIENGQLFENIIPDLDPLPQCEQLKTINEVYIKLRNKKWGSTLPGEIKHFLQAGASDWSNCRLEALKHLRKELSEKKGDLKRLFEKTAQVRDFHEDRKASDLHQLVCMLVKLSMSGDTNVSSEAACCLGEIGPSDLSTLILQSDNVDIDKESTPFQLLTAHIIELLYQYIVNTDHEIIKCSNSILYDVLRTKEGQSYIRTTENIDVTHLYPFLPKKKVGQMTIGITQDEFSRRINDGSLWWPNGNHDKWITDLVCAILTCFPDKYYLRNLIPLCEIKVAFCEEILPFLIHLVASVNPTCMTVLSQRIVYFFNHVWSISLQVSDKNTDRVLSTQCMLNVVQFCRLHEKKLQGKYSFDYLKIAQGAFYCARYFDALFYVELWCQTVVSTIPSENKFDRSGLTMLDMICESKDSETCNVVQNILRQSYLAIGEIDALTGCGHTFLLDPSTRIDHYKQLGKWDQVVLHYDTELSHGKQIIKQYFLDALKNASYYELATNYQTPEEPDYECFWRLGRFETDVRQKSENTFQHHKYQAMKSLLEKDDDVFVTAVSNARMAVVEASKNLNVETTKSVYNILTDLRMLQELEDFKTAQGNPEITLEIFDKWKVQDLIPKVDFKSIEPIKAQRIAVMTEYYKAGKEGFKEPLAKCYLDLAADARKDNHFNIAKRNIADLVNSISELSTKYSYYKVFEEAQICWAMNDKSTARYLIHHLCSKNDKDKWLNFIALKLYGQWMAECELENPQMIVNRYFLEPLQSIQGVAKDSKDHETVFDTYYDVARFSDLQYQRLKNYIKSAEFEQKVKNKEKSIEASFKIKSTERMGLDDDQKKAAIIYRRQGAIDQTEIENTLKEKDVYFSLAVKYYMMNLQYSNTNNIRVFRVLSLLLENRNHKNLEKLLNDYVPKIPTYKFVSILPQLVPHLTNNTNDVFGNHISTIIERCAKSHPHHTLPLLMALASDLDEKYNGTTTTETNEARILAAQNLLNKFKRNPTLQQIVMEMEAMSEALIELAYMDVKTCKQKTEKTCIIPSKAKINKIKHLSTCYIPTYVVDVKRDERYSDVVSIVSFNNEFSLVGGISAPKRVTCRCSDGQQRTFLVKGRDDLRQDAVMQQVFSIMNDLFRNNKHTSKLLIRTYKVTPLSKRSGVIEWVDNSKEIGVYLTQLHQKYNPHELSVDRCKSRLHSVRDKDNEQKLAMFKDICLKFSPVLHKFFEETYPHPSICYERRRAYMHSVATTSMCGYILGLGDRHGCNILLDMTTAEVIHIDFGIAFEQGKVLPTPETVPFRLSRDIEDGMGVSGPDGVFKRSCEKTMEVLRQNWQTIISILEVLLYDPLYAWTITPAQAYSRQFNTDNSPSDTSLGFSSDSSPVNVNVTAERAILRLHQKLHGTEEGGSSSVEGQVEKLIQQARDPANLSRLYVGWQPYL